MAVEFGADFIECDIQVTKDLQLICSHDQWIKDVCNVENFEEFSDRLTSFWNTPYGMYFEKMKSLSLVLQIHYLRKQNCSYVFQKTCSSVWSQQFANEFFFHSCRSLFEI